MYPSFESFYTSGLVTRVSIDFSVIVFFLRKYNSKTIKTDALGAILDMNENENKQTTELCHVNFTNKS